MTAGVGGALICLSFTCTPKVELKLPSSTFTMSAVKERPWNLPVEGSYLKPQAAARVLLTQAETVCLLAFAAASTFFRSSELKRRVPIQAPLGWERSLSGGLPANHGNIPSVPRFPRFQFLETHRH